MAMDTGSTGLTDGVRAQVEVRELRAENERLRNHLRMITKIKSRFLGDGSKIDLANEFAERALRETE